jgi:transposase
MSEFLLVFSVIVIRVTGHFYYRSSSGLDVHKRFVVACLSIVQTNGQRHKELGKFATMTGEILDLKAWLKASGCTHLALESTGVYWKPIFHLLEGEFEIVLVNAQHMKAVPGRKVRREVA